ncbi:MAG: D-hexose-6-phosphate mutarotase [Chthoniobacter sp.]|nr:D-hexose-6-phosphate mutarotase [Chthoniobacter sp.]
MTNLDPLRSFDIPDIARFEPGLGGLTRLVVATALAEAHVYLHGGHVTHFQPAGWAPVLFVSEWSFFAKGKPIRGGVPVCFPWFANRAGRPESPAHGFARTMEWEVESLAVDGDQTVLVVLRLGASEATRAHWPHEFVLRHHIVIGSRLVMMLEVENVSGEPFQFEEALHTYFAVSNAREFSITGLENAPYLDKADGFRPKVQGPEPLRFTAETDRTFENTRSTCVLDDPGAERRIIVEKSGSATTVVWNPWIEKAAAMKDFGDDEWMRMACIETANAGANAITLRAGEKHAMRAVISVA